jgi:hypothetical protein
MVQLVVVFWVGYGTLAVVEVVVVVELVVELLKTNPGPGSGVVASWP